MREEFLRWSTEYPAAYLASDVFAASPKAHLVTHILPAAICDAVPEAKAGFGVEGSAGQSKWTHTPWVAVLDPAVTETVQEGFYVVYLLSPDGTRIFLTLNQGCTLLKDQLGLPGARSELLRRAALMRSRAKPASATFQPSEINLHSALWRAQLYAAGNILSVEYDTKHLPDEARLIADLQEALVLYRAIRNAGGWVADDDIVREAEEEGVSTKLSEAKRYRLHRSIERRSGNAEKVKKAQGTTCKGCDKKLSDVYGPIANDLIHAHHLRPLANLELDEKVDLNPHTDFAVLCPNCHAIIHRFEDVGDVARLRALVASSVGAPMLHDEKEFTLVHEKPSPG